MIYRFIDIEKANYPIYLICDVLGIPKSSYYHWSAEGHRIEAERVAAEAELVDAIRAVHAWSNGTYGAVKIHDHLVKAGRTVSCRRVAEVMTKHRVYGVCGRRPGMRTTLCDATAAPFPDLVERRFQPCRPDVVWYGDITYIWVGEAFLREPAFRRTRRSFWLVCPLV